MRVCFDKLSHLDNDNFNKAQYVMTVMQKLLMPCHPLYFISIVERGCDLSCSVESVHDEDNRFTCLCVLMLCYRFGISSSPK